MNKSQEKRTTLYRAQNSHNNKKNVPILGRFIPIPPPPILAAPGGEITFLVLKNKLSAENSD